MKGGETMADMLIVSSKVKAHIMSQGCATSADALGAINDKVVAMLNEACGRCQKNKRATVKPQDV